MLESIIDRWGYLGVGLGTLLEGEATLLTAGALAHKGLLTLRWVMLVAFAGTALSDQLLYWAGRRFGKRLLETRADLAAHSKRMEHWLARYGPLFVTCARFLYGLRSASVAWLGASCFPYPRFVLFDTLGAALWAALVGALGWGLGASLMALLGRTGHPLEILLAAIVLAVAGALMMRLRLRRRRGNPVTASSR
jgi:membrane protein DedA with SNARE-associated domain